MVRVFLVHAKVARCTTSSSIDISIGKSVSDRVKLWQSFFKVRRAPRARGIIGTFNSSDIRAN